MIMKAGYRCQCYDAPSLGDSLSIRNELADFSHRYISLSLRPRKISSSCRCSGSPSPDIMNSGRPGDFDGPVLSFFRGADFEVTATVGGGVGREDIGERCASIGVPIFHTKGSRRLTVDDEGWKCGKIVREWSAGRKSASPKSTASIPP